jgi:nucleotide-binding universal stress UspA family protein
MQVLEADVPAPSSSTVKAWRSEQQAHESETEALLSFMQHHAVNLGVRGGREAGASWQGSVCVRASQPWCTPPHPRHHHHHQTQQQVQASDVTTTCLAADGGASGVGASIARHAADSHADMLVLGSRGLQGWQR